MLHFLNTLPIEILTKCLMHLDAPSLLTLLSVSPYLRSIASQDILWKVHCDLIYNKGASDTLGWRDFQKTKILPGDKNGLPYYMIWRRMHLCEDYLGWWLSLERGPAGIIMNIKLRGQELVVSHAIPRCDTPLPGSRGHVFALRWYNGSHYPLLIDSDPVVLEEYSVMSIQWLSEGPSEIMHHQHTLRTFHTLNGASTPNKTSVTKDTFPPYDWPSHRSPSLFAAIRHSGIFVDEEGYASATGVPTLSFPRPPGPRPFVALRSPFETDPGDSPIDNGVWLASYGQVHGCEFIYIQIRRITEADLVHPWGAEKNLALAFDPQTRDFRELFGLTELPASELSREDVRVGDRILEAIKVTGDPNVPRGVRTFVGFLDHHRAWSGPREGDDFISRAPYYDWPIHPKSTPTSGLAVTALPAALTEMKEEDVPARGMTLPGLMRVADTGFVDPKWADATIHISSRKEIRVMIQDGHHVTTFHKVNKDIVHCIR